MIQRSDNVAEDRGPHPALRHAGMRRYSVHFQERRPLMKACPEPPKRTRQQSSHEKNELSSLHAQCYHSVPDTQATWEHVRGFQILM